ncbi:duf636 domain protein [Colletotrichum scovillei]|uniref:CENP-V/GFA domain-containing protein n=2 Tax=Colletotrichum scovillei TaxID=1209932 RepID=A0A9P7RDE9_9PEZI|nr:duf636 domain protein [Colletotrichum scovillei]KAG7075068.1 DUF636 domain protein [Colletotrichum scovillei]KAG7082105.1 duf636 domain protein [Colletotrichum scovillei]
MVTHSLRLPQTHSRSLLISASGYSSLCYPHINTMSSSRGSCRCGNIKISFTGDPITTAACHCLDCRKVSGSVFGVSILVSAAAFTCDEGTPTDYASTSDSGNEVVNHFCGTCGVTLWADGASSPFKFVKAGVLDDAAALDRLKPAAEIYTCRRAAWCSALEGAQQKEKM